ncbi:MAG: phage tail protein [Bacteroidetes bacterium]|nr:phage tail protein [Bacteroidota bacterium]
MPKFYFSVNIDGAECSFQEVTGLETETHAIEYRAGNSKQFSTIKIPCISKIGNVTLKKGIFSNDNNFFQWYSKIKMNTFSKSTVIIILLDKAGKPTMTLTLQNAWPTKITGTDLKTGHNEIAVASIELGHEGITIANS